MRLFANLVFFLIAGVKYLPFVLVALITAYCAGCHMGTLYEKEQRENAGCGNEERKCNTAAAKTRVRKTMAWSPVIAISLLAVCKYALFTVESVNKVLDLLGFTRIPLLEMILPLGISFCTFMAISYILDAYWQKCKAEDSFLYFAVYLTYFTM